MREVSMRDLLSGLTDNPLGDFQPYMKHVSTDNAFFILRFDNGYGALVELPNRVTPIAWRPHANSVHDYYDADETIYVEGCNFHGPLTTISSWGPPAPF